LIKGKDANKKFIVLPIEYKYILRDLLEKIDVALKKNLGEILSTKELQEVRDILEREIAMDIHSKSQSKINKALKDYYLNLARINEYSDIKNISVIVSKCNKKLARRIKGHFR